MLYASSFLYYPRLSDAIQKGTLPLSREGSDDLGWGKKKFHKEKGRKEIQEGRKKCLVGDQFYDSTLDM